MDPNKNKQPSQENNMDSGSMDPATVSYLKGQISFQDYQTMLENQKILDSNKSTKNGYDIEVHDQNKNSQFNDFVYDICEASEGDGPIDLALLKPFTKYSSQSGSCSSSVKSYSKKNIYQKADGTKKFKDRFLNFKNLIFSSAEDTDNPDDERTVYKGKNSANNMGGIEGEYETEINEDGEYEDDDDDIDNLDETSNWNDFDIETLNFDKFIKDHQQSKPSESTTITSATPKPDGTKTSRHFNINKRKMNQDTDEVGELKAKRRVSQQIRTYLGVSFINQHSMYIQSLSQHFLKLLNLMNKRLNKKNYP